jgi:cytochrome P450
MEERRSPPGPPGYLIVGRLPIVGARDALGTLVRWAREYGDVVYYRVLTIHVYFLNDPVDIESVLVTNNRNFQKGQGLVANKGLFGNGLLTSEGDFWLRQRRLTQPAFHRERVAAYGEIMIRHTLEMLEKWHDGDTRDAHREMMGVTLAIAAESLFHADVHGLGPTIARSLDALTRFNSTGQVLMPVIRSLPTPTRIRYLKAIKVLDGIVYRIIQERRSSARDEGDLLSLLLQVRDENGCGMDDRQLRDETITLLLAGHETTAVTLSWTWYLLTQHPAVQEKLVDEIQGVLRGAPPRAEDVIRLPYTESVIKESMRLYPPAWAIARRSLHDFELRGYRVRKGASVAMSQWVLHRDPRFWSAPEEFRPERWLDGSTRALPRFAYFPFGGGPRICIGSAFAMMEATLLLAAIAQQFRLELAPQAHIEPLPAITLRPRFGIPVVVRSRK